MRAPNNHPPYLDALRNPESPEHSDAYSKFFAQYRRVVRDAVVAVLADPLHVSLDDIVDSVLDHLIEALKNGQFNGGSFKAWVSRSGTNKALNFVRDQHRRSAHLIERGRMVDSAARPEFNDDSYIHPFDAEELRFWVRDCLRLLSQDHRTILEMHYYERLSTGEISAALGINIGTVSSRLARAKRALFDAWFTHVNRPMEIADIIEPPAER